MPGSVSDSYDPEWGTGDNRDGIDDALEVLYDRVSGILGGSTPMDIRKLVKAELPETRTATLTEREWRLIRFALERARESP